MTESNTPQNDPARRKENETQPEKAKRRKKKSPIDFNNLSDGDRKLIQNIATTGARVAGRQSKIREGQMKAMKETLEDIFDDPAEEDAPFVAQLFEFMLENATAANAKKIAAHTECPANLAERFRRSA